MKISSSNTFTNQNCDVDVFKYEYSVWIIAGIFSILKLNHVIYALIGDGFGQMVL